MGLAIIDPPPPCPGALMLIFLIDSVTSTRLYAPDKDPAGGAAYAVSSDGDPLRVTLHAGGSHAVGTFVHPGLLQRLRGRRGTLERPGAEAVPVERWLRAVSGAGGARALHVSIAGQDYAWERQEKGGQREVLTLSHGPHVVATFVPSRTDGEMCTAEASAPRAPDHTTVTRAYVVFTGALAAPGATGSAARDEALLSLFVVRHLVRTSSILGTADNAIAGTRHA